MTPKSLSVAEVRCQILFRAVWNAEPAIERVSDIPLRLPWLEKRWSPEQLDAAIGDCVHNGWFRESPTGRLICMGQQ